jgi:endoglucanase
MLEISTFLSHLISTSGLSGHEAPIRKTIEAAWQPLVDELGASRLGSLQGLRRGRRADPNSQPPSLLLAAHMDAIGMMATGLSDGFIRITEIGGLDPRVLPGQQVMVHGRQDLPGVIVQPAPHLLPDKVRDQTIPMEYLFIDTGLLPQEVERLVRVGDLISFSQPPLKLGDEFLVGHSLDNRASVTALTHCLELLQSRQLTWDVWAVATAQEEETLGGALTSAYQLRPAIAVAIDVTFGSSPGSPAHRTFPLGKGITLGWGANIHPAVHKMFKSLADRLEIPYQLEAMPRHSGTDAHAMQIAAEGIPTMVVSIPLRYMHTPVEMVSLKDIQRAGRMLAEFAASLDLTSLEKLNWED